MRVLLYDKGVYYRYRSSFGTSLSTFTLLVLTFPLQSFETTMSLGETSNSSSAWFDHHAPNAIAHDLSEICIPAVQLSLSFISTFSVFVLPITYLKSEAQLEQYSPSIFLTDL